MRLSLTASYLLLITCAAGQTAQLRWDVQQDRPVAHDVYVWQGETVELMPRLVQGTQPVAVTNAPVEFRYREAALAPNQYRSVAAAANTNSGVLLVRWLPEYDAGADWYDYQIIVGSNAANPRAFGRITMRPTLGWPASTNPPPAILQYLTAADLQAASNALAAAVQPLGPRLDLIEDGTNNWTAAFAWGPHFAAGYLLPADISGLATTQQVAEAAAAIPRDRITTLDGSQWIDATGSVWRVTTSTVPDTSRLVIWHNIPGAPWPDAFVIDPFDPSSGYNEFVGFRWFLNLSSAGSVSSSYVMDYETGDMWSAVFDSDPLDYPVTLEKVDESSGMIVEYATSTIVTTSRVDGVAWQSDLPLYATTQQVAAALAPMATTGHVAQASLADADGYTTQMVMRVGSEITTNRWGPRLTLPDGIVTNGQPGPFSLGGLTFEQNNDMRITGGQKLRLGGNSPQNAFAEIYADSGDNLKIYSARGMSKTVDINGYVFGNSINWFTSGSYSPFLNLGMSRWYSGSGTIIGQKIVTGYAWFGTGASVDLWIERTENAYDMSNPTNAFIRLTVNNDLRHAIDNKGNAWHKGTNTAAVVVSQGPVFFGPVVNGKQMFLDGDGTNAWIVNVNIVTNAL